MILGGSRLCPSPGDAASEQAGEVAEDGKHVELIIWVAEMSRYCHAVRAAQ